MRQEYHESLLSNFGKTPVFPVLYFLPAKLDDWTEKEFGIKNPRNVQVENAPEETAKVRVVTEGEDEIDDRDAVIVEIKENDEDDVPREVHVKDENAEDKEDVNGKDKERRSDSESASEEK